MFGKRVITKRKVAWYGDEPYKYTYSKSTKTALPWTQELQSIKYKVESLTRHNYNSCLLNLYHDGSEGMGWHSDDEPELGRNPVIASVSLGATRRFALQHKRRKDLKQKLDLSHGSLLVMAGETQHHWRHQVAKTTRVKSPRVNLTFRAIQAAK